MSKETFKPRINNCRVVILLSLLVAIMGPWTFDRIHVPAQYTCSTPFVRLEGDFCGMPMSGMRIFSWMIIGVISMVAMLVTGETGFTDRGGEFLRVSLFIVLLLLLVLPIFSTLFVIVRRDRRRQVFNAAAWGLAAGIGLWIGISSHPKLFWSLWGIWLYIGLAVGALILEVLTLALGTRSGQG